jgi:hypothetical protein
MDPCDGVGRWRSTPFVLFDTSTLPVIPSLSRNLPERSGGVVFSESFRNVPEGEAERDSSTGSE